MRLGLVCNPYHRGGITRWMVDLAVEWRRQGGECWFVVPRPARPFVNAGAQPTVLELLASCAAPSAPVVIAPVVGEGYEFGTEAYRASVYAEGVRASVPAGVPLVVTDDPAAWRGAASLGARHPLVGVMHSDDDPYYALARRFGGRVSGMVCVSERVRLRTLALGVLGAVPLVTIPCGTRLPRAAASEDSGEDGVLRLAWVGRMTEGQKRVSDLPRIAARLRALGLEFVLDIFGDGPARASVETAVSDAHLEGTVRLHGWCSREAMLPRLERADVVLQPSNYEGMSVAVMEALAAGCAVVASRVSGIEDYEHHPAARGCVWLHAVGDVEAAARAVVEAAAVPRAERRRAARALARAEFSIEACASRYAELVASLAPPSPERAATSSLAAHPLVAAVLSLPVAAQRIARLWARGHRRRAAAPLAAGTNRAAASAHPLPD
jgi:glycosyltransferase involved in cell wall biosynthesis